ncbi:MAG: DUF192 domain-containing protein [Bacteroidota bacterium]
MGKKLKNGNCSLKGTLQVFPCLKRNVVLLFFGLITLLSCKEDPKKVIKTAPVVFTKEGNLTLFDSKTDSVLVKVAIEIAETDYETQTGLMYRKGMEEHQGMLFIFADERYHSFYMKNTEFPLDIIYIKEDLTIANFQENAQPLEEKSLPSNVPVQYVLELNAGLVQKWGIKVGDSISFTRL